MSKLTEFVYNLFIKKESYNQRIFNQNNFIEIQTKLIRDIKSSQSSFKL